MKNTTIFKRLLGYLKAYRLRLFFVLLSAVISTAFMVLAPFLVGKVTTTLFASMPIKFFTGKRSSGFWRRWQRYILYHSCFPFCRDSVWQRSLQM